MQIVASQVFAVCGRKVAVPFSRNILALRTRLRDLNLKSQFSILDSFRDIRVPDSFRDIHVHTWIF